MHHYTYILQSKTTEMRYIGVRSSTVKPTQDITYWGSSKHIPIDVADTHRKIILQVFKTRNEAVAHEIKLHAINNVGINPIYWNKAKQTVIAFDTSGVPMSDITKAKISNSTKGRVFTKEHLAKIKVAITGRIFSKEHRKNLSLAIKRYTQKKGYVNPRKGVILSAQTKELLSKNLKEIRKSKTNSEASPRFAPWFIAKNGTTIFYYTTTKQDQAINDGLPPATYRNLCTRSKGIRTIKKGKFEGYIVGNISV